MDGSRFKLDLNLRNLSMISIAAKLWDSQDIKNRIKIHFSRLDWKYPDENWREISKLVVEYANSINLPPRLSVLLKKTISLIGQKIYQWILYVTRNLKLDLICTENIYFSFGVVDEIKIFDLYWRDLMAAADFVYQSEYFRHSPLFLFACMFGCDRFVMERKNEMLDELREFYPEIKTGDEIYNIMSVSICMTVKRRTPENVPPPQRMFELCLEAGFGKAARFYWEKLDEVEKVSNLTNFAKKCWGKDYQAIFMVEKDCENLLFLINQMGEEERYLFLTDYADEIIHLFLLVWPYQELIRDLLKYDWNIQSSKLRKLAYCVISYINDVNRLECILDNELVFQIMEKVWENIPVHEKLSFLNSSSGIFLTSNLEILNLVFNDHSIREVNGRGMDCVIQSGFQDLVKTGKFDFLTEIVEKVFNFIPEPKEFIRESISDSYFVWQLMQKDESFGLLDQLLDFLTDSKAERASLKNKINTISYCRSLTESPRYQFELAEKFLKWKLESDGEVKRFKEAMKSYNFILSGYTGYVRIKSGDLTWFSPGDLLATYRYEDAVDNDEGLTFLKFEEATELNPGVVLGRKSGMNYGLVGPDYSSTQVWDVNYVGTKVGDFIVFAVLEFWRKSSRKSYFHIESIVNLSNDFIKFYYETEEEVFNFKKTKLHVLVSENRIELLNVLKGPEVFPESFLDDFCEFCMIPSEKIEKIKIQHRRDIEEFLDTYLIDQPSFQLVDIYLNWLLGEDKKLEVCKEFLNSSNKGALLCIYYLKLYGETSPLYYQNLEVCTWLNLIDDMEKLRNDVRALYENTPDWFPALLERSADLNFTAD